jgi:pimeloyl-ACP methyl ester carboxylesterase
VLQRRASRRRPDQIYHLYVPHGHSGRSDRRLLVTVHGYDREAIARMERFVDLAEQHNFVLLGPEFVPEIHYQTLGAGGDRADLRLLDLVEEVAVDLALNVDQFDLFGYSGGAQFAHRFLYVWPRRLRSVVVGAPGTVTIPSTQRRWPVGVRDLRRVIGTKFDLEEVRQPRAMLIVGTDDLHLEGFNQHPWAMRAGATRLDRARSLHAAWLVAGIEHKYVEVEGSAHGLDEQITEHACRFLAASP